MGPSLQWNRTGGAIGLGEWLPRYDHKGRALVEKEGIPANLYYRWNEEFLEAGKPTIEQRALRLAETQNLGSAGIFA